MDFAFLMFRLSDTDRREQRADPDSCRAEIVDLVDLQAVINLTGTGKNIIDLIRCHGV